MKQDGESASKTQLRCPFSPDVVLPLLLDRRGVPLCVLNLQFTFPLDGCHLAWSQPSFKACGELADSLAIFLNTTTRCF